MAKQAKAVPFPPGSETRVRDDDAREMEARGRMLTEYGALRRRLAFLMGEASGLGAEYQELSDQLRMCPNVVSVEGLIGPNSSRPVFSQSLFQAGRLVELVSEIRETIERKNAIQEQLRELGILDAFGQLRY